MLGVFFSKNAKADKIRFSNNTGVLFSRVKAKNVIVTLGSYDRCSQEGTPTLNSTVDAILLHPGYSPSVKSNDIALLRLSHTVTFSRLITPICMPSDSKYLCKNDNIVSVF